MSDSRGLNSFEATYQQLVMSWIDEQIMDATSHMTGGSSLLKDDVSMIAMDYARGVHRISTLREVRNQLSQIEKDLSGE